MIHYDSYCAARLSSALSNEEHLKCFDPAIGEAAKTEYTVKMMLSNMDWTSGKLKSKIDSLKGEADMAKKRAEGYKRSMSAASNKEAQKKGSGAASYAAAKEKYEAELRSLKELQGDIEELEAILNDINAIYPSVHACLLKLGELRSLLNDSQIGLKRDTEAIAARIKKLISLMDNYLKIKI